ncbi:MAG TPA: GH116 family glycosyl-hydrolase, partial [Ktedonobacteraceae bacterium]|nr:GH116 family glycosyl-hydrolase [Ktedonobacteraceae bacterium]
MSTFVSQQRSFWSIPACAWHHELGDVPSTKTFDLLQIHNTATYPKKGMPLGGIGAGNFMFNLCGSFGPWHFKPGRYEERFLAQAAFHVREEIAGQEVRAYTLATDDVLPAWPRLKQGDGQYYALFPRSWFTYDVFTTDISLQAFSPVIKENYRESSLPVAHFTFKLVNRQQVPAK